MDTMRDVTPAETAALYASLQAVEHGLLNYPTCHDMQTACPSCLHMLSVERFGVGPWN